MREHALRGVERRLCCVQFAAGDRHERLREAEPRAGGYELARQDRKPPGQGRRLAAQDEPVHVLLDHPRGLGGIPGGQRVAHGVVGQLMLLAPCGSIAVQRRHPFRPLVLQAHPQ